MRPAIPSRPQPLRAILAATSTPPSPDAFTAKERALIAQLRSPAAVQGWLNALPYNAEVGGETLRGFRGVVAHGTAHCLEAALFAAALLEQHGCPPLLLSFESIDRLDHVIYIYRGPDGWGSIARSRDPGLHGRRPVFATPRALALSYVDPYVDFSGRVRGYGVVHLSAMGNYDWRLSPHNLWAVEQLLIDWPHHRIRTSNARYRTLRRRYEDYRARFDRKPLYYRGRDRWMPLPPEFTKPRPRALRAAAPGANRDRCRGSAS